MSFWRERVPTPIRSLGRTIFRITGFNSYVRGDDFWWYRWHPDVGIGFLSSWERPVERQILQPGSCFIDAGSHIGRWALRASRFYDRVLAFEPDPFTNYVLRRNVGRNHIYNVLIFNYALSNYRAESALFNYGAPACDSLRTSHVSGASARGEVQVRVRPLDDFARFFSSPMTVKVDVEGEELRVLQGAKATIETFRPKLVVEVHFRQELSQIFEKIASFGYIITGLFSIGQAYLVAEYGP